MFNPLLALPAGFWTADLWYAVPLIIAVSLVYAATRHEHFGSIMGHAGRVAVWISGFMLAVFVVIQVASWFI
jgi:hypothetical protein